MNQKNILRATKHKRSGRILVFCGNGYVFEENFLPFINDLSCDFEIDLLMADYYLTESTKLAARGLFDMGKVQSYQVVQPYERNGMAWQYHLRMFRVIRSFLNKDLDLIVLGSDSLIFERYLLWLAKKKKARVIVVQTQTLIRVMDKYRKKQGLAYEEKMPQRKSVLVHKNYWDKVSSAQKRVASLTQKVWQRIILKSIRGFEDRIIYPSLFLGKFLLPNRYEKFGFVTGRAKEVICFDSLEAEAIKSVIPTVKTVYVARHPAYSGFCRCHEKGEHKSRKLLVIFSGCLYEEMSDEKMYRWTSVIKQIVKLADIHEVHLRPHPRTSLSVGWPNKLLDLLKQEALGCKLENIKAMEFSLPRVVCDYVGVLSAPSSALRVARAICPNIFAIGLPNCGDPPPYEESWMIGRAEEILWLKNGRELTKDDFKTGPARGPEAFEVSEILREALATKMFMDSM